MAHKESAVAQERTVVQGGVVLTLADFRVVALAAAPAVVEDDPFSSLLQASILYLSIISLALYKYSSIYLF
jgi:hypothetical protein